VLAVLEKNWLKKGFQNKSREHTIIEGSKAEGLFTDDMKDHTIYSKFLKIPLIES